MAKKSYVHQQPASITIIFHLIIKRNLKSNIGKNNNPGFGNLVYETKDCHALFEREMVEAYPYYGPQVSWERRISLLLPDRGSTANAVSRPFVRLSLSSPVRRKTLSLKPMS